MILFAHRLFGRLYLIFISTHIFLLSASLSAMVKEEVAYPLHEAARSGDVARIRKLIEEGAHCEQRNEEGETPLHCAALAGNVEAVKYLLALHAFVNEIDFNGETPLMKSSSQEVSELLKAAHARTQVFVTPAMLKEVKSRTERGSNSLTCAELERPLGALFPAVQPPEAPVAKGPPLPANAPLEVLPVVNVVQNIHPVQPPEAPVAKGPPLPANAPLGVPVANVEQNIHPAIVPPVVIQPQQAGPSSWSTGAKVAIAAPVVVFGSLLIYKGLEWCVSQQRKKSYEKKGYEEPKSAIILKEMEEQIAQQLTAVQSGIENNTIVGRYRRFCDSVLTPFQKMLFSELLQRMSGHPEGLMAREDFIHSLDDIGLESERKQIIAFRSLMKHCLLERWREILSDLNEEQTNLMEKLLEQEGMKEVDEQKKLNRTSCLINFLNVREVSDLLIGQVQIVQALKDDCLRVRRLYNALDAEFYIKSRKKFKTLDSTLDGESHAFVLEEDPVCICSYEDKIAAAFAQDKSVRIFNADTGECIQILIVPNDDVFYLVFSACGRKIAVGMRHGEVSVYEVESGRVVANILTGEPHPLLKMCFNHDGTIFCAASDHGKVMAWNIAAGLLQRECPVSFFQVSDLYFNERNEIVILGEKAVLWAPTDRHSEIPFEGLARYLVTSTRSLFFDKQRTKLFVIDGDRRTLHIFDGRNFSRIKTVTSEKPILGGCANNSGSQFALMIENTSGDRRSGICEIWDSALGSRISAFQVGEFLNFSMNFNKTDTGLLYVTRTRNYVWWALH